MATHNLRVQHPYFEHLLDGTKTFEVRHNDRAYQKGDVLVLAAYDGIYRDPSHPEPIRRVVTFVYSGDPRFGPWPDGVVVLGLGTVEQRWPAPSGSDEQGNRTATPDANGVHDTKGGEAVHLVARDASDAPLARTFCGVATNGTGVRHTASLSIVNCAACLAGLCHADVEDDER